MKMFCPDTETIEAPVEAPATETPARPPEEKETPEDVERRARKPPTEGPCKRCGKDRPLNRLFLCYPCWVKTVLEEKHGWHEGQPHPPGCVCEIECAIERGGFS